MIISDSEIREWLKLEEGDDATVSSLLITSKAIIKKSTGVVESDVINDEEGTEVYKTIQKILVTRLYENREGSNLDKGLVPLYSTLKDFKGVKANVDR